MTVPGGDYFPELSADLLSERTVKKLCLKNFFLILVITGALLSGVGVKKLSLDPEAVAYLDAGVVSDLEDLEAVEHMYE